MDPTSYGKPLGCLPGLKTLRKIKKSGFPGFFHIFLYFPIIPQQQQACLKGMLHWSSCLGEESALWLSSLGEATGAKVVSICEELLHDTCPLLGDFAKLHGTDKCHGYAHTHEGAIGKSSVNRATKGEQGNPLLHKEMLCFLPSQGQAKAGPGTVTAAQGRGERTGAWV